MSTQTNLDLIQQFFSFFGLAPDQVQVTEEDEIFKIDLLVDPSETGRYIGRFATTLDSLQLLVSMMLNNGADVHRHVQVDVGGYRQERLVALQSMASRIEADVLATGTPQTFPPLSATDRRAIHLLYHDHDTLTTESVGEGQFRRLILAPKSQ